MYYIAMVDDEIFTCADIENTLLKFSEKCHISIEIEVFYSGKEFKKNIEEGKYYDILFLDIKLPDINGINIANIIRNNMQNEQTQIIYISSKTEYALDLFKTRPMDFLVKPFTNNEVIEEFKQAKKLIDRESTNFEFSFKNEYYKIPLNKIIYFQSEEHKILLYTEKDIFKFYDKLDNIVKEIQSDDFWKIHKSYLINHMFITKYTYESVEMKNNIVLPISQSNRKEIRNKLLNYRKERIHGYKVYN